MPAFVHFVMWKEEQSHESKYTCRTSCKRYYQRKPDFCAGAGYVSYTGGYYICDQRYRNGSDYNCSSGNVQPYDLPSSEVYSGWSSYAGLYRCRCIFCNHRADAVRGIHSESLFCTWNLYSSYCCKLYHSWPCRGLCFKESSDSVTL